MTSVTAVSICSQALLLVGANEINSFSDQSRESKICNYLYATVLDDVLSRHPWRFSVNQKQLAQLTATPLYEFQYAYQLPTDMLRLISAESILPYQIYENMLYTDADSMNVTYQFRPGESKFPPYFVRLMVLEMAAMLASSLVEDEGKMANFKELADRQERKARNTDSQQSPSRSYRQHNNILATVRL